MEELLREFFATERELEDGEALQKIVPRAKQIPRRMKVSRPSLSAGLDKVP